MPDRLPVSHPRPWLVRYGAVLPALALATLATTQLAALAERAPFVLYFAVVTIAAVYGGLGPALLAIALSVAITTQLFLPALGGLEGPDALVRLAAFVGVAGLIGVLAERGLHSERRERARREWSEVTLASIGDAVIVTDAEGGVLSMNRAAEHATGWTRGEARGHPLRDVFQIVNEQSRQPVEDPVSRVRREQRVVGLANHTVLLRRDGGELPIDDSGAPIWSDDGELVGAVLVFRDISERKLAERRQAALLESERQAKRDAEAANAAKDAFLAMLSHELRTPLNAILGWTQLLTEGPVAPAELERGLEVISRNARLQTRLIDDVLDISRIVSGKLRVELASVDLGQVLERAIEHVRPMLEQKRQTLEVEGECGGSVLGDAHRLEQVLGNLLSNATKFTPAGARIVVSMQRSGTSCRLAVRDEGRGIAPEFLPHVFEAFRQEQASSSRSYGGLGLGLAIVRHLVEMHGGSVAVTSDGIGKGACVTVELPLAAEATAGAAAAGRPASTAPPDLAGLRVLAVDDDADSRQIVATILARAGAEVRVAASADEALRIAGEWPPDLLLSDLEMPGEDGYGLLRLLRAAGFSALPAIALTAYAGAPERMRALEAGFLLHLPKPLDASELQLVVARVRDRKDPASSES